jgi:hypothetical protein
LRSGWATAVVLASLCGCGPPAPTFAVALQSASLDGMTPQPLESESTLVSGAQGGFHVWLTVKLTGAPLGPMRIKHTIRRQSDGQLFSTGDRTLDVGEGPDGVWESTPAWPAFLCPSPLGINVLGEPAVIKLELSIKAGTPLGTAEVKSMFLCPADQQAFCERICKG